MSQSPMNVVVTEPAVSTVDVKSWMRFPALLLEEITREVLLHAMILSVMALVVFPGHVPVSHERIVLILMDHLRVLMSPAVQIRAPGVVALHLPVFLHIQIAVARERKAVLTEQRLTVLVMEADSLDRLVHPIHVFRDLIIVVLEQVKCVVDQIAVHHPAFVITIPGGIIIAVMPRTMFAVVFIVVPPENNAAHTLVAVPQTPFAIAMDSVAVFPHKTLVANFLVVARPIHIV